VEGVRLFLGSKKVCDLTEPEGFVCECLYVYVLRISQLRTVRSTDRSSDHPTQPPAHLYRDFRDLEKFIINSESSN
jgi:hypothetical protein